MKYRKKLNTQTFSEVMYDCSGMNFADCCMNELELRICRDCKTKPILYIVYKPFEKCQHFIINVCYYGSQKRVD